MIRTQVYIPDDLYYEAKLEANGRGTNVSTLIRQGLKRELNKETVRKSEKFGEGFFGALTYGPKDLSTKINDIYR